MAAPQRVMTSLTRQSPFQCPPQLLLALLVTGVACAEAPVGTLFEVPVPGQALANGYYSLPYPNDLRIKDDGLIDLTGMARPNALLEDYLDTIAAQQRGFGLTSALFVRFDGAISLGSLPADAAASREEDASVYLVNIDPDSPTLGTRLPLQYRFADAAGETIGEHWLGCLPFPGFVLEEETTYALVLTSRLRSKSGDAVLPSADFREVMATLPPEEPRLARAHQIYQPLHAYLDQPGGDERADVVNAAVFTTQNATGLLGKFREAIYNDVPAPTPRDIKLRADRDTSVTYIGLYDSPIFQSGEFPYRSLVNGGGFELDPTTGLPVVQGTNELRFAMTLPKTPMPAEGWPMVLYGHGTGGDFRSFEVDGTGFRLAEEGIAVMSIDQPMHGTRLESGDSQTSFFNFLNPLAARGNVVQAALEDFQLVRLVEGFDYLDVEEGREIRFDANKLGYFGHSQGSVTGLPFVAHEPKMKGAIFSGAGGLLYLTMLYKTLPFDIPSILALIVRETPLDEFNQSLALMEAFFEPADAIVYGRLLVDAPPEGNTAKNVLQTQGLTDRYTPVPSIEALATAIDANLVAPQERQVAGLELLGKELLTAPISGNAAGGVTSVLAQYQEAQGSDGHFVVFDIDAAKLQSAKFLRTLFETGIATFVAP